MVQRMEVATDVFTPMLQGYEVNSHAIRGKAGFYIYDDIAINDVDLVWSETGIIHHKEIVAYTTWRHLLDTVSARVITPAMVAVKPEFRGSKYNLAILMYKYVLHHGYIIQAGDIKNVQSKGGFSLWLKMLKNPSIAIYAQHHPLTQPLEVDSETMLKDCVGNDTVLLMRHRRPNYV